MFHINWFVVSLGHILHQKKRYAPIQYWRLIFLITICTKMKTNRFSCIKFFLGILTNRSTPRNSKIYFWNPLIDYDSHFRKYGKYAMKEWSETNFYLIVIEEYLYSIYNSNKNRLLRVQNERWRVVFSEVNKRWRFVFQQYVITSFLRLNFFNKLVVFTVSKSSWKIQLIMKIKACTIFLYCLTKKNTEDK